MTQRDSESLSDAIKRRREELGVTQEEFAEMAGLSLITVQRVETGRVAPRAKTFAGLDRGARGDHWPAGTARAIFEGKVKYSPGTEDAKDGPDLRDDVERDLWAVRGLSEDERWSYIYQHRAKVEARRGRAAG